MASKRNIVRWKDTTPVVAYTAFGVSSHENDYRLSWCVNCELGLAFAQAEENFETKDGKEFSCFVHQDEEQTFSIISNRNENGVLLKKYKNLDFIFKFDRELDETEKNDWLQKLRKVTLVSAVFELPGIHSL